LELLNKLINLQLLFKKSLPFSVLSSNLGQFEGSSRNQDEMRKAKQKFLGTGE
jgi:hypothetical protein